MSGALAAAALVAVAGVFLSVYVGHPYRVPVGYDTPKYIWRARLVAAHGMAALGAVPHGVAVTADRPGYPVLVDLWSATLGASPFRLAMVVPAITAVMIACGGAAFARACLVRPQWQAPAFAVAVGASPLVALMAGGHADNMLLAVVALGAAAAVLTAAAGERTIVASALLLGSGAAIHWNFAALVAAMLVVTALVLVPESLRARRAGTRWWSTPSARMAGAVAAGTAVGGAALALAPVSPGLPGLSRPSFLEKLRAAIPWLWWPLTVPAAVVGGVAIAADGRRDRRPFRALVFLGVWALGVVVAIVALEAGSASPAHRVLEFSLAIPILAAAGVLAVAAWVVHFGSGRSGRVETACRIGAGLLVAMAVVGTVVDAARAWGTTAPTIVDSELSQIRAAAEFVDRQPPGHPTVVLVDTGSGRPDVDAVLADHWMRLSVDADHITATATYVGDLDPLLAGEPTVRGDERFDRASRRFTTGIRSLMPKNPSVVVLSTLNRSFDQLAAARAGSVVAPGVAVIRGPLPPSPLPAADLPGRPSWALLALLTAGGLAVAAGVGSGWSRALVPVGVRAWLAPALGVAVLVLAGTAADAAGLRLHGVPGVAVVVVAAAGGWLAAGFRSRRVRPASAVGTR